MTNTTDKTKEIFWRLKNPQYMTAHEVAEGTNSKDPVADHLPFDPRRLISHDQQSQWSSHPRTPTLPRVILLFWMASNTDQFIGGLMTHYWGI